MSVNNTVSLYDIFPFCKDDSRLPADFSGAKVTSVVINSEKTAMTLAMTLERPTPPYEIAALEEIIANEFGLSNVSVSAVYSRASAPVPGQGQSMPSHSQLPAPPASRAGAVIMGRRTKSAVTHIGQITLDHGKAAVCGEVCDVSSR